MADNKEMSLLEMLDAGMDPNKAIEIALSQNEEGNSSEQSGLPESFNPETMKFEYPEEKSGLPEAFNPETMKFELSEEEKQANSERIQKLRSSMNKDGKLDVGNGVSFDPVTGEFSGTKEGEKAEFDKYGKLKNRQREKEELKTPEETKEAIKNSQAKYATNPYSIAANLKERG